MYGVELTPNQVIGEIILDGGGHFIPEAIFGLHTLSLLLASRAAHNQPRKVPVHIQERNTRY